MGDRGQVRFVAEDGEVWFYTHWGATELVETVRSALIRGRSRWSDSEYLARIIFSEMIKDAINDLTHYGIGFSQHGDVWRVVVVDSVLNYVAVFDDGECVLEERFLKFVEEER